ncbi:MAG: ligase-associated DNA damage response endonuclease PdeM [Balneolaceae bacterium]
MSLTIKIKNNHWTLLPERALFWKEKKTLIAGDLHLGKSGHFRKSGIAAPQQINQTNLDRLERLVHQLQPERLLLLGDLFHSDYNREWFPFEEWCTKHPDLKKILVAGNHDTLHETLYRQAGLDIHEEFIDGAFEFNHKPAGSADKLVNFRFCGHIHPGVKLKGKGRQSLRLPCFYREKHQMILPAFGEFTGLHLLVTDDAECIYTIANRKVVSLKEN